MSDMLAAFNAVSNEKVDVQEFDVILMNYRKLRDEYDERSDELKKLNEMMRGLETQLLDLLKKTNKQNWTVDGFGTVYKISKLEVKFPQRIEDRRKLAKWITTKYGEETRDALFAINYQSLNKFYNEEVQKAKERGVYEAFKIDGLDAPVERELVGFRRK